MHAESHHDHAPDDVDHELAKQQRMAFVLVDISGYTRFVVSTRKSVLHAQEIIFQLLESVVESSELPLEVNKLEGDAVLLYARAGEKEKDAAEEALSQAKSFFAAFRKKAEMLTRDRASCSCSACSNISSLRLKAILHFGSASLRSVRGFVELGGEDVIIVHRLLKNSVSQSEYLLLTASFHNQLTSRPEGNAEQLVERDPVLGEIPVWIYPAP